MLVGLLATRTCHFPTIRGEPSSMTARDETRASSNSAGPVSNACLAMFLLYSLVCVRLAPKTHSEPSSSSIPSLPPPGTYFMG